MNRIDDIVRFRPLTEADLVSIVDIQLAGLGTRWPSGVSRLW